MASSKTNVVLKLDAGPDHPELGTGPAQLALEHDGAAVAAREVTGKVYRYGLRAPTEGEALARKQLWLAWLYRVQLLRLVRARRAVEREIELRDKDVAAALARWQDCCGLCGEIHGRIMAARQNGGRNAAPGLRDELAAARDTERAVRKAFFLVRGRARVAAQLELVAIGERWRSMRRSVRAHYSKVLGLRHGTYTFVDAAVDQACGDTPYWRDGQPLNPRWKEWDGTGTIGEQIRRGITVEQLHECAGRVVRLSAPPWAGKDWPRHGVLSLRVGSDCSKRPIWARWPSIMHRPLPEESLVKRLYVQLSKEGPREVWSLLVTVEETARWRSQSPGMGAVAVDIGWRRLADGTLRVAAWHDEQGRYGTVVLDEYTLGSFQKAQDLQSIRDRHLDELRGPFCRRLEAQPGLPEWMRRMTVKRCERAASAAYAPGSAEWMEQMLSGKHANAPSQSQAIATIAKWRSQARLHRLHAAWIKWRSQARLHRLHPAWMRWRWVGDGPAFEVLARWAAKDRHLWQWEGAQRTQALRHRREQYRKFSAWLTGTYEPVVLERFDLRRVAKRPEAHEDQDDEQTQRARRWRQLASTHELRDSILNAARSRGVAVHAVGAAWSTQDCPRCGHAQTWDAKTNLRRTPECPACGCKWDQDSGAAMWLLRRYREQPGAGITPGSARATQKRNKHHRKGESRWQRAKRMAAEKQPLIDAARNAGAKDV